MRAAACFGGLLLALLGIAPVAHGQAAPPAARYWVAFADKQGVKFQPKAYFSAAALARRRRLHLPAAEATDLPVRPDYLAAVQAQADTITVVSRWLNGVVCRATPAQAVVIGQLPGVALVQPWPVLARLQPAAHQPSQQLGARAAVPPATLAGYLNANDYLLARQQTAVLGRAALAQAHLAGRGVRIAVLDVGFRGADQHLAFAGVRREKRIAATYDFLRNQPDVFRGGAHGTEVLGCLAGRLPAADSVRIGPALGLAAEATYLLARTESLGSERFTEEEAWLKAMEWADQQGADIISSSLAYTEQRYFPEQMDGRHSLIGRAATRAARKGILVVSAAGNDGDDDWGRIGTPADADSVLAVGGLDPATGLHLDFSSTGPSADRRLKPDVSAFGIVLTTTADGGYERVEGTSFAAPLVAGLAACAQQAGAGRVPALELYRRLRAAGELYPYYDYAHGFGLPTAGRLLALAGPPAPPVAPTFDFVVHDSLVAVVLRPAATVPSARPLPLLAEPDETSPEAASWLTPPTAARPPGTPTPTSADVPRVGQEQAVAAAPALSAYPDYPARLYWHLADRRGVLRRYEVRAVLQRLVVQLPRRLVRGGDVLRVYYRGYTGQYAE